MSNWINKLLQHKAAEFIKTVVADAKVCKAGMFFHELQKNFLQLIILPQRIDTPLSLPAGHGSDSTPNFCSVWYERVGESKHF